MFDTRDETAEEYDTIRVARDRSHDLTVEETDDTTNLDMLAEVASSTSAVQPGPSLELFTT